MNLHLRTLAATILVLPLAACSSKSTNSAPTGPPTDNLQAVYNFDAGAGDGSANAADGALLGGATAAAALVMGNNDTDALTLPNTVLDGLGDFTVAAWVKINTLQAGSNQFLSGSTATEDNSLGIWYSVSNDRWKLTIANVDYDYAVNAVITDNAWHHIVVMRVGSTSSQYIDGVLVGGPVAVSAAALEVDPTGLIIGQDQDALAGGFDATQCLAGEVDNLRIYRRGLTAAEVLLVRDEAR